MVYKKSKLDPLSRNLDIWLDFIRGSKFQALIAVNLIVQHTIQRKKYYGIPTTFNMQPSCIVEFLE